MTNKIIIIGNLTKDVDYLTSASGVSMARFTVAVNRRNNDGSDFFPVTAFRKTAEICADYLSKGKKVCVVGEIHINEYTSKDGVKRTGVEVNAAEVEFLSPKEGAKVAEQKAASLEQVESDGLPF